MGEPPSSAIPQVRGLDIEAVEWLPSGADSGLVRVRGRWTAEDARLPGLPELGLRVGGAQEQRFESLPDARFARDPDSWRGSYLVPSELVAGEPPALWVQWGDGTRAGLPPLDHGLAPAAEVEAEAAEGDPAGGQVYDAAVLAERRARRAEAEGQRQGRKAAEALQALQALELRSADLERRLAEADVEHDAARAELERRLVGERALHEEIREELTHRLEAAGDARARAEATMAAAEATLAAESAARVALEDELDRERAARAAAEAALETARKEAEAQGGALHAQIAELDRRAAGLAHEVRLEQAARQQAEAAAARGRRPEAESGEMVAALAAAAAALREAPAVPEASTAGPAVAPEAPEAAPAGAAVSPEAPEAPEATPEGAPEAPEATPEGAPPAPEPERVGPTIVSAPAQLARGHVVGRSRRDYPPLRGAVVKLAHDDPLTAGRLLAGLLPAQGLVVDQALDYDLTIREVGTFSVALAGRRCFVNPLEAPRPRGVADFHLSADALVLAELLAGVHHRIGRFTGAVRYTGRRRRMRALRALRGAPLTLAEAVRGGARLEPELAYRALAYAVHPSWTKGRGFTIAQTISGARPETWFLTARDGAGLTVADTPPPEPPAARVTMTRDAFDRLLRGEPVPRGQRPAVRGDHLAVALMKSWTDRAQGLAGPR